MPEGRLRGSLTGGLSFVCPWGDHVSNPSVPTRVTTYDTPGRAQDIVMKGLRAYVADGPGGVQVIDLTDPSRPTIVGSFKTMSPARHLAVNGSQIVAALGATGAVILTEQR